MKAKIVKESMNKGIPWSGIDVTKAPIIGRVIVLPLAGFDNDTTEYDVVEVVESNGSTFYICNFWYKYSVPQVIPDSIVKEYIEYKSPIDQEDSDKDFRRSWGSGILRDNIKLNKEL